MTMFRLGKIATVTAMLMFAPTASSAATTHSSVGSGLIQIGKAIPSVGAGLSNAPDPLVTTTFASYSRPLNRTFFSCDGSVYRGPVLYEFHMAADGRVSCGGGVSYVSAWIELDEEWASGAWHRMSASGVGSCRAGGSCSGVTVGVSASCTVTWKNRLWRAELHWAYYSPGGTTQYGNTYHYAHGCLD